MPAIPDAVVSFIETEFQTCDLYLGLAFTADDDVTKQRLIGNARKAYDAIVRFLPRLQLSRTDLQAFQLRLTSLKMKLESLDEIPLDNFAAPRDDGAPRTFPSRNKTRGRKRRPV